MDLYRPEHPFRPHRWPRDAVDRARAGGHVHRRVPERERSAPRRNGGYARKATASTSCTTTGLGTAMVRSQGGSPPRHSNSITGDNRLESTGRGCEADQWRAGIFSENAEALVRKLPRWSPFRDSRQNIIDELGSEPSASSRTVGVAKRSFVPARITEGARTSAAVSSTCALKGLEYCSKHSRSCETSAHRALV